jgi:hypothetical protein
MKQTFKAGDIVVCLMTTGNIIGMFLSYDVFERQIVLILDDDDLSSSKYATGSVKSFKPISTSLYFK